MATATPQHASGYNSLSVHVREKIWNPQMAQDTVFNAVPYLNFLMQLDGGTGSVVEYKPLDRNIVVRIIDEKAQGGQAFSYYDTLNIVPSKLGAAANFTVANYVQPIQMSWQEEMEFTTPEAFADYYATYIELAFRTQSELLADDLYGGNALDSKKMLGLEQMCVAKNHLASSGSAATNITDAIVYPAQLRQGTDSFGGITRSAWSISSGVVTAGTGWEANVVDYDGLTISSGGNLGYSSGALTEGFKRFHEVYYACSEGQKQCNVILMSPVPYQDYEFAAQEKMQLRKTPGELSDFNLGFEHSMFKSAVVIRDPRARSSRTSSPQTIGDENIYFLNTDALRLCIDSRANHTLMPMGSPQNQLAGAEGMVVRLQHLCVNPRLIGRISQYVASQ